MSPTHKKRVSMAKESVAREEKVYREIMGPDGKVK